MGAPSTNHYNFEIKKTNIAKGFKYHAVSHIIYIMKTCLHSIHWEEDDVTCIVMSTCRYVLYR